jgi:hypothetical protein
MLAADRSVGQGADLGVPARCVEQVAGECGPGASAATLQCQQRTASVRVLFFFLACARWWPRARNKKEADLAIRRCSRAHIAIRVYRCHDRIPHPVCPFCFVLQGRVRDSLRLRGGMPVFFSQGFG